MFVSVLVSICRTLLKDVLKYSFGHIILACVLAVSGTFISSQTAIADNTTASDAEIHVNLLSTCSPKLKDADRFVFEYKKDSYIQDGTNYLLNSGYNN